MKTVVGLYDYMSDARDVIDGLVDLGIDREDISLLTVDPDKKYIHETKEDGEQAAEGAAGGAAVGGIVGGLTGLIVGLGVFTIPGVGVVVAAGPIGSAIAGAAIGAVAGGIIGALIGWGIPEEEAGYYAEGVRRGGKLVAVKVADSQVDAVTDVMNDHDPVDVEERAATWKAEGWRGYDSDAEPYTTEQIYAERNRYNDFDEDGYNRFLPAYQNHYTTHYGTGGLGYEFYDPAYRYGYALTTDRRFRDYNTWNDDFEVQARRRWDDDYGDDDSTWDDIKDAVRHAWEEAKESVTDDDDDTHHTNKTDLDHDKKIEVVKEDLAVGKREVDRGGVRVRSYVETTPVEEDVTLRKEKVVVDRRSVDRPADTDDLDAFEETHIEMTETDEEVVVEKKARVIEEIVIGKEVETETEHVRDSVRETKVDIDRVEGNGRANGKTVGFDTYRTAFETHYNDTYRNTPYSYEQYKPAYRYGYNLANHDTYGHKNWNEVEAEARRRWDDRNEGTWEEFKDAVHRGWLEVKQSVRS